MQYELGTHPSMFVALSLAVISVDADESVLPDDSEPEGPCFSSAKNPYFAMSLYLHSDI